MVKKPYRPLEVVEITKEKIDELLREGLEIRRKIERDMRSMFIISPENWHRRMR